MDSSSENDWQKILNHIKKEISSGNFRTWFSQTSLDSITDSKITISVPSAFIQGQLKARYGTLLRQVILEVTDKDLEIDYQINPAKFKPASSVENEEDFFQASSPLPQQRTILLNPRYTLENFVVGPTNNLAYAAAQAVLKNPGISYNPLFIYGESGVGKTHLMQAIGNSLLSQNPSLKIIYASSERFMNDFIESIQNKKTGDFRFKYRSAHIFLIDDVQFLAGKDSTQEEFFHTYNDLHTKNTQIILTSDRPPNEMQRLESRLVSRFQGGLMVDIQLPDFETRVAILKAKLNEKGDQLPEDCVNLIAETMQTNTRELEGKLIQILQMVKLKNQTPSLENIRQFLGKQTTTTLKLDPKKLLSMINNYFNLRMVDLLGPRRQRELVLPRQIAMYLMYKDCEIPMERIGQLLGGRDHTTILHGIKKIEQALVRDREIQRLVVEVKQTLIS